MALLGHTARYVIPSDNPEAHALAWEALGFTVEDHSPDAVRLTDGQILLTLLKEDLKGPALAYFNADPDKDFIASPFGVDIYIHKRPYEEHLSPTRESNDLLGFFDGLVVGVDDVAAAREASESYGYFLQEEWGGEHPQSDITDGLCVVSLRKQKTTGIFSYTTDLSESLVDEMDVAEEALKVSRDEDGRPWFVRIKMPDGTLVHIMNET